MTSDDLDIIVTICSQMLRETRVPVAEHGVAVATTWSPVDDVRNSKFANTIEVTSGKTAGMFEDDGDHGVAKPRIDVASTAWGLQHAPRGGERIVMVPTESSPIALVLHGDDDSCATLKPGETILRHFNGEVPHGGKVNTSLYFANDAAAHDNLGQIAALAGGLLSMLTTAGYGFTVTDSSGTIVVTATVLQLGGGSTTSVQIAGSGTTADDGLVRKSDLRSAINSLAMIVQGGGGVPPPTVTASSKAFTA